MAVTYGFYNSINGDRRYNADQMSSLFDGLILDGIYQHVGNAFIVKPLEGMTVTVDPGRAWFNHTWTLNDTKLPIVIPESEVILKRIDAIVIEVDSRQAVRANSIILVKGAPSSNPTRPTLVNTDDRHQYALAYIQVNAGVTSIRSSDITSMIGTTSTPFVTAPFKVLDLSEMLAQWKEAWDLYFGAKQYEAEEMLDDWETYLASKKVHVQNQITDWERRIEAKFIEWQRDFSQRMDSMRGEFDTLYSTIEDTFANWTTEWESFYDTMTAEMIATKDRWAAMWDEWFLGYVNNNTEEMVAWRTNVEQTFNNWFNSLQIMLDENVATNLANDISKLDVRIKHLEECCSMFDFTDGTLTINEPIEDSTDASIRDYMGNPIQSRMIYIRQ